jgi:tRNA(Ile)-lysidine synthase
LKELWRIKRKIPRMEKTEQKFLRYIDEHKLINREDKLLIGFSGGPDSVFLLHLLNKFSSKLKIELHAIHINHGLRGKDADEDEEFCRAFTRRLNIDFVSVKKNVRLYSRKNRYSLEEAGRILRYKEFSRILKSKKLDKIATAHNAGDNTETVLLNLIKGTGIDGISGIPPKRENIIRPVLCFNREEILFYLKKHKILFRTDKTNEETEYERNYLRHKVIPLIKERLNPSLDSSLLISAENFRDIRGYILSNEKEAFQGISRDSSGNLLIKIGDLKKAGESLKGLLVKIMLERELGIQIFSADLKKIFQLAEAQTGKKIELSGGIVVFRERKYLKIMLEEYNRENFTTKIFTEEEKFTPEGRVSIRRCDRDSVKYSNNKNKEYIAADAVSSEFTIRRWREGDSFRPLGMKGTKKISDFLNEQKVESSGKKNHLILLNKNKIVWVIGLRIDERFKITNTTHKILELCLN